MVQCFKLYFHSFYWSLLSKTMLTKCKFSQQVVGRNTLGRLMQKICKGANFSGIFTRHSGRLTCATKLFLTNSYSSCKQGIAVMLYGRTNVLLIPTSTRCLRAKSLQPPLPKCANPSAENNVTTEMTENTNRESPVVVERSAIHVPSVPQLPTGPFSATS